MIILAQVTLSWEVVVSIGLSFVAFVAFLWRAEIRASRLEVQVESRLARLEQKVKDLRCNNCKL